MASLYNYLNASRVETFLSDLEEANLGEKFHDRERLLQCIHMLIWLHSSRPGSTAGAYACAGLMDALGLERWQFKKDPEADRAEAERRASAERTEPGVILNPEIAKLFPERAAAAAPRTEVIDTTQQRSAAGHAEASDQCPSPSRVILHAVMDAADSVFLERFSDLVTKGKQPTVDGKPTSYSAWISAEIAPGIERTLRRNAVTHPTDEMVEAAADCILAEWKAMAAEQGADLVPWPISPTNPRLLRAGIRGALEKAGRIQDWPMPRQD